MEKDRGEGSYSGTRDYNRRTENFVRAGRVKEAARKAAPKSKQEAHAMHEAEQLCDRVGIVHHGRLVAYGSPSELTTNAGADMRFSAASGLDVEKLAHALELPAAQVTEVRPGDYFVDAPATPALVAALAGWLEHEHVLLSELRAGQGSLEDVFLRLTGDVGE